MIDYPTSYGCDSGMSGAGSALYASIQQTDVPPRFADSHRYLENAFESLDQSGYHLERGIRSGDVSEINLAGEYLNDGTAEIDRALELFD